MAVKRSFSSAIVYSKRLSKGKVALMVLFMMDKHCDLFKVSNPHLYLSLFASDFVGGMKQSAKSSGRVNKMHFYTVCMILTIMSDIIWKIIPESDVSVTVCETLCLMLLSFPPDPCFITQNGQWQNNKYCKRQGSRSDNRFVDFPCLYIYCLQHKSQKYETWKHFALVRID